MKPFFIEFQFWPWTDKLGKLGVGDLVSVDVEIAEFNDVHAALSAVDDGEIFLLDDIEDRMKLDHLSAETRNLLNLAMDSAIDGDAFAGRLSMAC